jgi:hypothetical protein
MQEGKLTEPIEIKCRVRQVCVLSPVVMSFVGYTWSVEEKYWGEEKR